MSQHYRKRGYPTLPHLRQPVRLYRFRNQLLPYTMESSLASLERLVDYCYPNSPFQALSQALVMYTINHLQSTKRATHQQHHRTRVSQALDQHGPSNQRFHIQLFGVSYAH